MFSRIKELCQQFPQGITDQVIQNDLPHLEPQQRAMALNKLLSLVSHFRFRFGSVRYSPYKWTSSLRPFLWNISNKLRIWAEPRL